MSRRTWQPRAHQLHPSQPKITQVSDSCRGGRVRVTPQSFRWEALWPHSPGGGRGAAGGGAQGRRRRRQAWVRRGACRELSPGPRARPPECPWLGCQEQRRGGQRPSPPQVTASLPPVARVPSEDAPRPCVRVGRGGVAAGAARASPPSGFWGSWAQECPVSGQCPDCGGVCAGPSSSQASAWLGASRPLGLTTPGGRLEPAGQGGERQKLLSPFSCWEL